MTNTETLTIRLPAVALARLDELRRREPQDVPSRPEMIRRLIDRAEPDSTTAPASKAEANS